MPNSNQELYAMNDKIESLNSGERLVLSESNGVRCAAERSGDGKRLRFIRETATGFKVFYDAPFEAGTPRHQSAIYREHDFP
jgi:hypothetical protein